MSHAICNAEKMSGTYNAVDLAMVIYAPSATPTAIDNGNVVLLDARVTGEREVVYGVTPAANSAKAKIALVCAPEVQYDERLAKDMANFVNEAGAVVRAYRLERAGQVFSVTADGLTGAGDAAVGDVVELQAGTKLKIVDSLTAGSTKIGEVIDIYTLRGKTYYAIETV